MALLYYAFEGNIAKVRENLTESNIDTQDEDGETPLMKAAKQGHIRVVQYLTESGANLNIQDVEGNKAIHKARDAGKMDIVSYLSKWMKKAYEERSAYKASQNDLIEAIRFMNDRNSNMQSFISQAIKEGNMNMIRVLLRIGVPISSSLLEEAILSGRQEIVMILREELSH